MKWVRSMVSTADGGRPLLPSGAYGDTNPTSAGQGTTRSICAGNSRLCLRLGVRCSPGSAYLRPVSPPVLNASDSRLTRGQCRLFLAQTNQIQIMARPILGASHARTAATFATPSLRSTSGLSAPQLQHRLRQTRSRAYVEALTRLDAGAHHGDRAALDALIDAIGHEFPELTIEQRPLGIVSRCYLGAPYEVHVCDLAGNIIEHFEKFRSMPPLFERARSLAKHKAYTFIEIYADTLRAVAEDGSVSVIEG